MVEVRCLIKVTRENSVNVSNLFIVLSDLYTEGTVVARISCQCDWLWIVGTWLQLLTCSQLCIATPTATVV